MAVIYKAGDNIWQVDLFEQGIAGRTSCFIVAGKEKVALVETGPTPSTKYILEALEVLGIDRERISYVFVTHIHLDHAGGAGNLLRYLPRAYLAVHPRGARHMISPEKLEAAAKAIYGERFLPFFEKIIPAPVERVLETADGQEFDLGGRVLTVYHTSGHARHHQVITDSLTRGLFSGDMAGVLNNIIKNRYGKVFVYPSTPATEFEPEKMILELKRFLNLGLERIYYTHFGVVENPGEIFHYLIREVEEYERLGQEILAQNLGIKEMRQALTYRVYLEAAKKGVFLDDDIKNSFELDLELNAAGILHYLTK
ncbi:MBL fold metallo-hydrolase [Carboxydothermus hydrogenoformans]|uniref:Metallo-beta-lactamase family protein n=1 Tax=Carboxydothermus hydrogenoformans (strain ATCC BAA-161 / DSM 6008 / Z-2901) TaxID=246194 RepID=Q3AF62_CARHZ|nr:MBL fold metallo-hydrolase [Carboxydothermus hydrogenoformans]ABB14261.1 metallo-beta-lactamase family protein [Carboxydothermus hydrogenoformans Z-2901]